MNWNSAGAPGMPLRGQNSHRAPQSSGWWGWGLEVIRAKNCPERSGLQVQAKGRVSGAPYPPGLPQGPPGGLPKGDAGCEGQWWAGLASASRGVARPRQPCEKELMGVGGMGTQGGGLTDGKESRGFPEKGWVAHSPLPHPPPCSPPGPPRLYILHPPPTPPCCPLSDHLVGPPPGIRANHPTSQTLVGGILYFHFLSHFVQRNILFKSVFGLK